ncbi:hypothetical protein E0W68_00295 [Flavobacterium salilacus subsp. salilacus]|uniref:DUF6705 family protein n=1 Tax=Flavobacterium TaxID=237 RepID=UPI001074F64C|nr:MULTISPECIES: hypothetical protein [Flavobacterium]KAF2519711.1 hypothetical protein E0W68_00295 [Flavobacterium salilacus subsp. salilacus]MBE1614400.1 hypothetical protein [Flavobacterium sp. SaA2.13]
MQHKRHITGILFSLLPVFLGSVSQAKAQQLSVVSPYQGTWHYQNGNELFIVTLWKEGDSLLGHYKMVTINSSGVIISTLYNSRKLYNANSQIKWPPVINTSIVDFSASGVFLDNTINYENVSSLAGDIRLDMQQTSPLTIHWKIKKGKGIRLINEPELNIPIDIILTKVSNEIDLE